MWNAETSCGSESLKIKWALVPYTRGAGLDLGCGANKPFPHFIGVDSNVDAHLFGAEASGRSLTANCERLKFFADGCMDFVFSSHLLEHIQDYKAALKEWWRVLKDGGNLCLYLPHRDYYPNVGQPGANPDHKHDFAPQDIIDAMQEVAGGWELLENETRSGGNEYSFFQVYRKGGYEKRLAFHVRPQKTCAVVRYGAIGDVLQSASILPGLKEQGYHVTFFCTPLGKDVLAADPNIDAFVVQDENQVPNHELEEYFAYLATKYTKVVNLCETVEGIVLPMSKRAHFHWPKEARHMICNRNYVELQHEIAGVPYRGPVTRFYPTPDEAAWAKEMRAKARGPVIAWALAGSAVHKIWPFVDDVVARIRAEHPEATVVFTGGASEAKLHPETEDPMVWKMAGQWTVRQSLAFVREADIVVGPETGVVNSVCIEPSLKVVLLSHSTTENLTRDWANTIALAPQGAECYPCHRLQLDGWKYCNRHEIGVAVCQVGISAQRVYEAIDFGISRLRAAA